MFIIGIDPGAHGCVAMIPLHNFAQTRTFPLAKNSLQDISNIFRELRDNDERVAVCLEEPQLPMFNGHTKGNFNVQAHTKLGRSVGQLEGICIAHNFQPVLMSPRKWQNKLKCATKGNKNVTKNLAIKLFPNISKTIKKSGERVSAVTHDIADALLIALYGYLEYANPKYYTKEVRSHLGSPLFTPEMKVIPKRKGPPSKRRI